MKIVRMTVVKAALSQTWQLHCLLISPWLSQVTIVELVSLLMT
jgi:hypothetical protein